MTDISRVLPHFPVDQYASLVPALEKHGVTVTDLLTLEVADLSSRTRLPLLDLKRLCNAVLDALHADMGVSDKQHHHDHDEGPASVSKQQQQQQSTISTLDPALDAALGGGIPTGYVTEVAGEAGAGKTQLLLSLLLAVQLPPPRGLGRRALYVSTEAPLSTPRLAQMLRAHRHGPLPSLDNIISTTTPDLESQEHILTYQVPVEVARSNVGLLVLDSVAANYRAEFDRADAAAAASASASSRGSNMAARGAELVRLGMLLRDLARAHNLAVVVSNQVADRFDRGSSPVLSRTQPPPPQPDSSPLAGRSRAVAEEPGSSMTEALSLQQPPPPPPPPPPDELAPGPPPLDFDHQQRWFTGWGDDAHAGRHMRQAPKTPSLGLVWATQVACRIALFKAPRYGRARYAEDDGGVAGGTPTLKSWRRWAKVVFAPHVAGAGPGLEGAVEFEITMGGLRGVVREDKRAGGD